MYPKMVLSLFLFLPAVAAAQGRVHYGLQYLKAGDGRVRVSVELDESLPGIATFVFPRAIPMGYGEQPLDRFVGEVRAFSVEGDGLPVQRGEGPRWILIGKERDGAIRRLEYEVDIRGMEGEILSAADTSKVRPGYLGILGYTVFGFIHGMEENPIQLEVRAPGDWPVYVTLAPQVPPAEAFLRAEADNFYELADSQILLGPEFQVRRLDAVTPLYLALYSEGHADAVVLSGLAEKALRRVAAYFGGVPFRHYTVVQEYLKPISPRHDYGFSMEHLDSGTFFMSVEQAISSRSTPSDLARTLYNFAHHIAHSWIPKRCHGEGYFPFNWARAPILDTVWFSEGFPQYAAVEALADGMPEEEGRQYREGMLEARFRFSLAEAPPFIRRMSLLELSRAASTRYAEDFRLGRSVFSRGGLMAAEMDDYIRKQSGGRKSLKDALRFLVAWSKRSGRAFSAGEIPVLFFEATGVDTSAIMQRWMPAPDRGKER